MSEHQPKLCIDAHGKTSEFLVEGIDWSAVKQSIMSGMRKIFDSGRQESVLLRHVCEACGDNDNILRVDAGPDLLEAAAGVTKGDSLYDEGINILIDLVANDAVKLAQRYYNPPRIIIDLMFPVKISRGTKGLLDSMS